MCKLVSFLGVLVALSVSPTFAGDVLSVREYLNKVNANLARYRGQEVTISGVASRATWTWCWRTGTSSVPSVEMRVPDSWSLIVFEFPRIALDSVSNIEPNDIVIIRGVIENSLRVLDARVISIEKNNPPFSIRPLYSTEEIRVLIRDRVFLIDGERFRFTDTISQIDGRNGEYLLTFGGGGYLRLVP